MALALDGWFYFFMFALFCNIVLLFVTSYFGKEFYLHRKSEIISRKYPIYLLWFFVIAILVLIVRSWIVLGSWFPQILDFCPEAIQIACFDSPILMLTLLITRLWLIYYEYHFNLNQLELQWRLMLTRDNDYNPKKDYEYPWTHHCLMYYTIGKPINCILLTVLLFGMFNFFNQITYTNGNKSIELIGTLFKSSFLLLYLTFVLIFHCKTKASCRDVLEIYGMYQPKYFCLNFRVVYAVPFCFFVSLACVVCAVCVVRVVVFVLLSLFVVYFLSRFSCFLVLMFCFEISCCLYNYCVLKKIQMN